MQGSDYVSDGFKDLSNMTDEGYYISKSYMDKITVHVAKNFMDLPKIKVPLILGIWGGKGQGKTFQSTLIFKRLGIAPIIMSAGELESGNAGEPAKLIRQRYREASDIIKKGKMSTLFINDLDAGAGRMGGSTQYTVNNQMVNATLMNLADNPTNVQLPGQYQVEEIPRVPIIATGNDFSTLYAPLIRDGRMDKFYWSPTFEDRCGVACGIFKADGVNEKDVEVLVRTFDGQSIDFFGALRARVYDQKVREWVQTVGQENIGSYLVNPSRDKGKLEFEPPAHVPGGAPPARQGARGRAGKREARAARGRVPRRRRPRGRGRLLQHRAVGGELPPRVGGSSDVCLSLLSDEGVAAGEEVWAASTDAGDASGVLTQISRTM